MDFCYDKFYEVAKKSLDKHARSEQFGAVKEAFIKTLSEEELEEKDLCLVDTLKMLKRNP